MLFDLSGKRKRVVQVVYAVLALLMGGSLVLFGIGSDAPGGLLDAVGLGSNNDSSSNPQYEQQIEDAQAKLEADPQDAQALLALVRYHYLSATSTGVTTDPETGQVDVSEDARGELEQTVAAWERYLKTKPAKENVSAASSASQAYRLLGDAAGAAAAQRLVAESQGTAAAYGQLAFYLYANLKFAEGDAAAAKAIATASPSDREQVRRNLEQLEESARKQKKQLEKAAEQGGKQAGEEQLTDPFGTLGGSSDSGLGAPAP